MIDFQNGGVIKLKETGADSLEGNLKQLLIPGEQILQGYKGIRDYVVFTTKRIIAVNIQGITGKKKDYTSLPYSKIQAFSIETAGNFDLDSELDLFFSGLGHVRFEFSGRNDIVRLGQIISERIL
ncbi:PH domain-containing protein [Alloiococcus sp. CFN-8]|uniref:PH domain-containing protein n=1 Tax=Alloiococcus sp. CFN-8 TaxID=3416081 RepID=UPI003CEF1574